MEEISRLPQYVSESAVTLIFLSRGYFKSKNCLIEFREAVVLEKPLVLCHHSNLRTGGSPMQTLIRECPDECERFVFGDASDRRPVVPWVRQPDFELETLKQITVATIMGCEAAPPAGALSLRAPSPRKKTMARAEKPSAKLDKHKAESEQADKTENAWEPIAQPHPEASGHACGQSWGSNLGHDEPASRSKKASPRLFLPGEMGLSSWKLLKLRGVIIGPERLTFSASNPGAAEVASRLAASIQHLTVQLSSAKGGSPRSPGLAMQRFKNGSFKASTRVTATSVRSSRRGSAVSSERSIYFRKSKAPGLGLLGTRWDETFLLLLSTQVRVRLHIAGPWRALPADPTDPQLPPDPWRLANACVVPTSALLAADVRRGRESGKLSNAVA